MYSANRCILLLYVPNNAFYTIAFPTLHLVRDVPQTMDHLKVRLQEFLPFFDVDSSQIDVLYSPSEFVSALTSLISQAKSQIFISSLYIGNEEEELVRNKLPRTTRDSDQAQRQILWNSLDANPSLKLSILIDGLRGTRESPAASSASLLTPLISRFGPDRVEVRLFQSPAFQGTVWQKLLPKRSREIWGLTHMKIYGADDRVIISG